MTTLKSNTSSRLKRLFVLQRTTIRNYDRIVKITTETDLQSFVRTALEKHKFVNNEILQNVDVQKLFENPLSKVRNYVDERWKRIVTNIIVNNKSKILEHLWQAEIKILQEVNTLINETPKDSPIYTLVRNYEREVYSTLDNLDYMIRRMKSAQAILAK